jgi:hypothetical protein
LGGQVTAAAEYVSGQRQFGDQLPSLLMRFSKARTTCPKQQVLKAGSMSTTGNLLGQAAEWRAMAEKAGDVATRQALLFLAEGAEALYDEENSHLEGAGPPPPPLSDWAR